MKRKLAQPTPPNWKYWPAAREVKPWEAVALSMNFDPFSVSYEEPRTKTTYWTDGELRERLLLVAHDLESRRDGVALHEKRLQLGDFAKWALSIGWKIPAKLKSHANAAPPSAASGGWPWGGFTTKKLEHLAAAAREFWADWDGTQATAPKTDEVVKWLEDRGISTNIATAIATILRADSLPSGPRTSAKRKKG